MYLVKILNQAFSTVLILGRRNNCLTEQRTLEGLEGMPLDEAQVIQAMWAGRGVRTELFELVES